METSQKSTWMAYGAMLLAMVIVSGNFVFGNHAMQDLPALPLSFWRTVIAMLCLLPLAIISRKNIAAFFFENKLKAITLVLTGVVLPPWFIYLALNSSKLVDLSVGYTSIPLMTVLLSAIFLSERLSIVQYLGLVFALFGSLVFAFHGDLENVSNFDPHVEFLWIIACAFSRSVYLVLLKLWNVHPSPSEGLFLLLLLGTLVLLPGFVHHATTEMSPLEYSPQLWGSILFIGIGMGAVYLYLLGLGTSRLGATTVSLFTFIVPVLVAVESILFLDATLQPYQAVGGVLVLAGVFCVAYFRSPPPTASATSS